MKGIPVRVMGTWDNLDWKGPQEISSPTFYSYRVSMGSDQSAQCVVQLHSEILKDGDDITSLSSLLHWLAVLMVVQFLITPIWTSPISDYACFPPSCHAFLSPHSSCKCQSLGLWHQTLINLQYLYFSIESTDSSRENLNFLQSPDKLLRTTSWKTLSKYIPS